MQNEWEVYSWGGSPHRLQRRQRRVVNHDLDMTFPQSVRNKGSTTGYNSKSAVDCKARGFLDIQDCQEGTEESAEESCNICSSSHLANKNPPSIKNWPVTKILEALYSCNISSPLGASHKELIRKAHQRKRPALALLQMILLMFMFMLMLLLLPLLTLAPLPKE